MMEKDIKSAEVDPIPEQSLAVVSTKILMTRNRSTIEACLLSLSNSEKKNLIELVEIECDGTMALFFAESYLANPEINQKAKRILAWANALSFDSNIKHEEIVAFLLSAADVCLRVEALRRRSEEIQKLGEFADDNIKQIATDEGMHYLEDLSDKL